ncbi:MULTISPECIES: nitrate reductase molybdenum cofactor assembly chaperone [unclassified Halomonas]|uniref:nitrate reductase molybdenum cofactor assembly chaperone n=1 Tax=unclassified Halomonas TaxID=2609666 RepID=UPI0007F17BB9|nr:MULTISPECIES: nitrate reductase molybdenum cofactor assembly chaperone [unclassified Halomonas]SBR51604.1 respiratory nitrate reductase chaperone NarJ [Halomonas sp. HL-93]SNY97429.1 respiratory nitrate reductase chaperone NarJ [Halomonas sp. hl-4]
MGNVAENIIPPVQQGMLSLRVLARLLDYPTTELQQATGEMIDLLDAEKRWRAPLRQQLMTWCQRIADADLLELQAEYVALFDKGRATSLLLFEHVHGESRDRGQAMVDLMNEYQAAGFELDARELPDYLPLFLEYLSTRSEGEIARWLGEIQHILALLTARMEARDADHALVPYALLALIGAEQNVHAHRDEVSAEAPDDTPEALDAVWEEEAVRFSADSDQDCALQSAEGRRLVERKKSVPSDPITIMPSSVSAASSLTER